MTLNFYSSTVQHFCCCCTTVQQFYSSTWSLTKPLGRVYYYSHSTSLGPGTWQTLSTCGGLSNTQKKTTSTRTSLIFCMTWYYWRIRFHFLSLRNYIILPTWTSLIIIMRISPFISLPLITFYVFGKIPI